MIKKKTSSSDSSRTISQPAWLTLVRVALGAVLIWKGVLFIRDTTALESLIRQTGIGTFTSSDSMLALIVTFLTLLCGFFITVGLFTRIASIIQIPILLVAVLFVNIKHIDRDAFQLILSVVVLLLLIFFAIKGSGFLSADEYFRRGAAQDNDSDRLFR